MSHIVTIATKVRDPLAVAAACRRLGLSEPVAGTARLFGGEATGLLVQLPDWQYPVVIDVTTGTTSLDDYGGRWGDRRQFDLFLQAYAVEVVKLEARKKGFTVTEQALGDGTIKVQLIDNA